MNDFLFGSTGGGSCPPEDGQGYGYGAPAVKTDGSCGTPGIEAKGGIGGGAPPFVSTGTSLTPDGDDKCYP